MKSKFNSEQRKALSDFFVNIGSAWFIGGIVTNFFVKPELGWGILFDIFWAIVYTLISLFLSWLVLKK